MELSASTSSASLKRKLQPDDEKAEKNSDEIKRKIGSEFDPSVSISMRALMLILHWHEYLMRKFGIQTCENICDLADLTLITLKIYTFIDLKNSRQDKDQYEFSCNGTLIKFSAIKDDILTMAKLYGLYDTVIDNEFRNELQSLLLKMSAFQERLQEIIKQIEGKVIINRFLSGMTYNKYHQMNMKSSMGVRTITSKLLRSTKLSEQNDWVKAFSHAYKEIPHSKEIANFIQQKKVDNPYILNTLEHIASAKGLTNATNEVYMPAAIILTIARTKTEYKSFFDNPEFPLYMALSMQHICTSIQNIDFTFEGAFNIWNKATEFEFRIKKLERFTVQTIKELIFHAYFGTFYEDVQLLTWMTEHEFQRNYQLKDQWKDKTIAVDDCDKIFSLIKVRYIAKLKNKSSYGYRTDFLHEDFRISHSILMPSGWYVISDEEKLFRKLYKQTERTWHDIPLYLCKLKNLVSSIVPEMGRYSIFDNHFYEYDDTKDGAGVGNRVSDIPEYAGRNENKNIGKYIDPIQLLQNRTQNINYNF